jgi:Tol biopolymer transport system component
MKTITCTILLLFISTTTFCQNPGNVYQITNDPEWAEHPCWSNDGNYIAIESNRSGVRSIWRVSSTGLEIDAIQLTDDLAQDFLPRRNPNNDEFLFFTNRFQGNGDLWAVDQENFDLRRITTYPEADYSGNYSFDGSKIAFISQRAGNDDIWIMPSNGGPATQLTSGPAVDSWPNWSPDGSQIVYYTWSPASNDIWIVPSTGGDPVLHIADAMAPCWSPDGTQIAFSSNWSGNGDLWIYNLSDSSFTQMTTHPDDDFNCNWSPDGTKLAFTSTRDGNDDIWVIDLSITNVEETSIIQNVKSFPNPFVENVAVNLEMNESSLISVSVININGKVITSLVNRQKFSSGKHSIEWSGKNDSGNIVKSGIYYFKIRVNDKRFVERIIKF